MKVNNVITVPTTLDGNFFKYWFEFLKPFHKLPNKEIEVIAAFVKHRYELSKIIKDSDVLDRVVINDVKMQVIEELGLSQTHYQALMSSLRKHKIIENGRINPKFIPKIDEDSNSFNLLLAFDLK